MTTVTVSTLATPLPAGKTVKDVLADYMKDREYPDLFSKAPDFVSRIHKSGSRLDIGFGYDVISHSMDEIKSALAAATGVDVATYAANNKVALDILNAYKTKSAYTISPGVTRVPTENDVINNSPELTRAQADTLWNNHMDAISATIGNSIVLGETWEKAFVLDLAYNIGEHFLENNRSPNLMKAMNQGDAGAFVYEVLAGFRVRLKMSGMADPTDE